MYQIFYWSATDNCHYHLRMVGDNDFIWTKCFNSGTALHCYEARKFLADLKTSNFDMGLLEVMQFVYPNAIPTE